MHSPETRLLRLKDQNFLKQDKNKSKQFERQIPNNVVQSNTDATIHATKVQGTTRRAKTTTNSTS